MIDINLLRENPDVFRASQRARGKDETHVDRILEADTARRALIGEYETLRAEQNAFGKTVAKAPKEEKPALVAQAKELAARVNEAKTASEAKTAEYEELISSIENLIIDGVPVGGEDDYVVVKEVGTPRDFTTEGFEPRDHLEIGELVDGIDMARGAKVSGARFYFLKGQVARLEQALMWMALDLATEHGFTMMTTPTLVRPEIMNGTGFNVKHDDEIYRLERDDLYLVGTSEVALAGYHTDEILDFEKGAKKYLGWSSCYRREAGSAGKDTRGIIRVHQFNKAEMFVYCPVEQAEEMHEKLLSLEEEMLQRCGLAYRVIDTAAGDLGTSAARKFDCEAWVPTQGTYRELTSTSNCTTYQARRLNIRERTPDTVDEAGNVRKGRTRSVATLNGTLATTRWVVAILETHQQADGSVRIPEALRPYMGGAEVIPAVAAE
ncbi:serine--tRNA ligase [Rothia mucilaginosa ATCC 25296]|uniref:serine--tRNA ligase n=1 Tax=Rothia mucilaginosa TaxID=43675 RepID=UPI0001B0AE0D|nr:serine--tRNA ligase [Rothia mucilaginosa]EET76199.1 serine--tRNA ligase [Rothia mucilaginosa ATCC 25296]